MKRQRRRMQGERLGIAERGENFDRAKYLVQRAEQRINTVYVKNLILKNQNW
jgi:hypothetical protein